jgi:hypothetical protein
MCPTFCCPCWCCYWRWSLLRREARRLDLVDDDNDDDDDDDVEEALGLIYQ